MRLQDWLHRELCTLDHTDGCCYDWHKDYPDCNCQIRYREKAASLLDELKSEAVVKSYILQAKAAKQRIDDLLEV